MTGRSATRTGSRPSGGAAKASPAKPSIPSASRRRTFKPFAQAPRDGTPFIVPHIARYNPFAKTFELLMTDQYSGDHEWVATPRVWRSIHFCDLLPRSTELPKAFEMTLVATPVRQPTWRERIAEKLFGNLHAMMRYALACDWRASAMSAGTAETQSGSGLQPASATRQGDAQ